MMGAEIGDGGRDAQVGSREHPILSTYNFATNTTALSFLSELFGI